MNIFMLAQAQDAAGAAGQEPANMFQQILASPMFMFVIIIVLFWVMLIRPQRKAQKEQQARIAALQRGDKVITNAGLHGFVEKERKHICPCQGIYRRCRKRRTCGDRIFSGQHGDPRVQRVFWRTQQPGMSLCPGRRHEPNLSCCKKL